MAANFGSLTSALKTIYMPSVFDPNKRVADRIMKGGKLFARGSEDEWKVSEAWKVIEAIKARHKPLDIASQLLMAKAENVLLIKKDKQFRKLIERRLKRSLGPSSNGKMEVLQTSDEGSSPSGSTNQV